MLKDDHDRVKKLFDEFESAKARPAKKKIAAQTLTELKLHAALEEDIFYAAVRKKIEKKVMNEADEEHHVAKVLIAELEAMNGAEDHYDAKYQVLSENVRHHIKEEESDMLPKARGLNIDYDQLGEQMRRHKRQLLAKGFPTVGEETMVAASRGKGDSPAKAAKKQLRPGQSRKSSRSRFKPTHSRKPSRGVR
ncbi:MAG: hemerythrin domain-containing protein [Bryobacteraceae bacterium]